MGLRIDPCGAASVHSAKDEHVSLILVCSFLEFKCDSIQSLAEKLNFDGLNKQTAWDAVGDVHCLGLLIDYK